MTSKIWQDNGDKYNRNSFNIYNDNDNDNEKTFIAKVVQRKSVNHTNTQFNLKDSSGQ